MEAPRSAAGSPRTPAASKWPSANKSQWHRGFFSNRPATCYQPPLLFNREGDCLAVKPRPGNVPSADAWDELLLPEIERQQEHRKEVTKLSIHHGCRCRYCNQFEIESADHRLLFSLLPKRPPFET
jgi:hypothetical protein